MNSDLIKNIDKIHTTELGLFRIKKNLNINGDIMEYCKKIITNKKSDIKLEGKNYYVNFENILLTINKYTYTIITAHII